MPSRTTIWTLAIFAIVVVIVPLLGMAGMMTCCGAEMMGMGGGMMGMSATGAVWLLAGAAAVTALVVMLIRGTRAQS